MSGLKAGGIGAVTGGMIGGAASGYQAYKAGANFWTGKTPMPEFISPVLDGSPYISESSMPLGRIRSYSKAYVEIGDLSSDARLRVVRPGYDINKAVTYMNENAASKPVGYCARHVRKGMEAGGMSTAGRPGSAYQYADYLPTKGFRTFNISSGYAPLRGDIAVISNFGKHVHGHIQMYNGVNWVSDFVQRNFWPSSAYRLTEPSYTIFRW